MRRTLFTGVILLLSAACLRENYNEEDCRKEVVFNMEDVPYVFQGDETVAYRPYYTFTESLNLFVFAEERLQNTNTYDYEYCRTHPMIPYYTQTGGQDFLFVANLYDPKELDWKFLNGELQAIFLILDNEEPPLLLAAKEKVDVQEEVLLPVELYLLVSRLEIRVDNPPAWMTGLDVNISNIAGTITSDFILGDTTHIFKHLEVSNLAASTFWSGINAFPTYPETPALLNIQLTGGAEISSILVDDDRLYLVPGIITRVNILFETENEVKISLEVDGKWEIVDGGHITI